jgi:putative ABC transport system permease protein
LQRLEQDMQEMEEEFARQGVALTLDMRYQYNVKVYVDDPDTARHIIATRYIREGETGLAALEGSAPHLGNEIAMTRLEMEVLGVEVGDRVHVVLGSTDRAYLITGSYENMINLGLGLTFSTQLPPDSEAFGQPAGMTGTFVDRDAVPAQIEQLKQAYPSYTLWTAREFITDSIGDIYATITGVKNMILVLVFGVNLLVVVLLSKTLLARNRGEIALLKSLGFANGALVRWQVTRMALVAVVALAVGLLLATALNPVMMRFTFGLMGAPNIPAVIEPLETFVLYPALLLTGTVVAVFLSVLSLRSVDKRAFDAIE